MSEIEHTKVASTAGGKTAFKDYLEQFAHIEDPLERRRLALEEIDNAGFGWTQAKMIMIAGVGFMTDSYDIFAINLGTSMLAHVYWAGSIPDSTNTLIKVSTSVGTVIGQLGFGFLADVVGRKKIYGLELIVMIAATIFQCTIGESPAISFVALFASLRIVMGIGIGGDYPLSSIISSEFSTTKWRGAIMAAVFSNQGLGQLLAGIVALVIVSAYRSDLEFANSAAECVGSCVKANDQMWRILIGFGCVPGCIALYYRLTIAESPRYSLDVEEHDNLEKVADAEAALDIAAQDVAPPKASFKDFIGHFGQWRYGKILIGTATSWFFLDVAYYGLGLNTAVILKTIGYASSSNVYESLYNTAVGNLILICAGSLPGYWVTAATVDTVGRKPIQFFGFIILTALFCILGFAYDKISDHGKLALYVLAQFFQNFGPNTTTFIIPGEIFPTRYRSTAHGMSAALGKIGAIVAQTCIGTLINHGCATNNSCFLPHVMEIFALFMLLGVFSTLLIPETKRMTLEEICEKYHGEIDSTKLGTDRYVTQQAEFSDSELKH
ncbi:phosphate permease [Metschnikowia bicuspidata var. bicuspidata NRRL YB-4993]|uniref:Phosphate permease n=1 Tax=Metschnikowia bicuspidata var. bicuspidata NRRL YB-4993 TaxID=869754 RepID=A0A1A0HDU9_9ASCO|nr:phosphate permease [Metschnikowia bicuspidata var. bicuspidata NRRL YB-4993]OBA22181.1 phosphate permease [Metschnikowia bicuspidata var. bicuspidata NRRL YB-4993]